MTTTTEKTKTISEELAKLDPQSQAKRISELTHGLIRVTYQPEATVEGDSDSRGHLYLIEADESTGCKLPPKTYYDDRDNDDDDIVGLIFYHLDEVDSLYHNLCFNVDRRLQPEAYDEKGNLIISGVI